MSLISNKSELHRTRCIIVYFHVGLVPIIEHTISFGIRCNFCRGLALLGNPIDVPCFT